MSKSKFLSAAALNAMVWGLATAESCEKTQETSGGSEQNQDPLKGLLNNEDIEKIDVALKNAVNEGRLYYKNSDGTKGSKLEQKDLKSLLDAYHKEIASILEKSKADEKTSKDNVDTFLGKKYDITKINTLRNEYIQKNYIIEDLEHGVNNESTNARTIQGNNPATDNRNTNTTPNPNNNEAEENSQIQDPLKGLLNKEEKDIFKIMLEELTANGSLFYKNQNGTQGRKLEQKDLKSLMNAFYEEIPSMLKNSKVTSANPHQELVSYSGKHYDQSKFSTQLWLSLEKNYVVDQIAAMFNISFDMFVQSNFKVKQNNGTTVKLQEKHREDMRKDLYKALPSILNKVKPGVGNPDEIRFKSKSYDNQSISSELISYLESKVVE